MKLGFYLLAYAFGLDKVSLYICALLVCLSKGPVCPNKLVSEPSYGPRGSLDPMSISYGCWMPFVGPRAI